MPEMADVYNGSPWSFITQVGTSIIVVKVTRGTYYINPFCDSDYQAAKKAGRLLGVYHYAGDGNPTTETNYSYKNTKDYVGEAVPTLDWKGYQNPKYSNDLNQCHRLVDKYHELSDVQPSICTGQAALPEVRNYTKNYGLWPAQYVTMNRNSWILPAVDLSAAPWPTYTIQQFMSGDMDHSIVSTTEEGWLKLAKPNVDVRVTVKLVITETRPCPEVKKWVNDLGDVWYSEKGAFATGGTIDLRCGARTSSKVVAQLPANTEVRYDAHNRHGGRAWIRQPRSNGYGCLVCRTGNEPWGTFK